MIDTGIIDLRQGNWRDVISDVEVDVIITDPPFSGRTHKGYVSATSITEEMADRALARAQKHRGEIEAHAGKRRGQHDGGSLPKARWELPYLPLTEAYCQEFVEAWRYRVRDWMVIFGDHISNRWWLDALDAAGWLTFAPVPWVRVGSAPRFAGDGPANNCEWIAVARPKKRVRQHASRPGFYMGPTARAAGEKSLLTGGKPLWLMQALVRDYSLRGDRVCDPHAGSGTTLLAAAIEGRLAIGAELDERTWARARGRIRRGHTPNLPLMERRAPQQLTFT